MYNNLSLYDYYISILANCRVNSHANNLIGSHSNSVVGWTLNNVGSGQFNIEASHSYYKSCGNGKDWFGFGSGDVVGMIKTILNGCGQGILDYGNCHSSGQVEVLLDGVKIDQVGSNTPSKIIEFSYTDGSILEIREPLAAIIKFNKFYALNCYSCD